MFHVTESKRIYPTWQTANRKWALHGQSCPTSQIIVSSQKKYENLYFNRANLNAMEYPKFKVLKRSCGDRWTLLRGKCQKKMTKEIKASGIDVEVNEIDTIIEELIGLISLKIRFKKPVRQLCTKFAVQAVVFE